MDSPSITMAIAILALICLSAYFSATETAFSSLNRIRLKSKADGGDRRAALALSLSEEYDRLLSTILIGNNIVNITATTVGTVLFTRLAGAYGPTVSTVVLTVVILIFGEISPKSLAKENPEKFAMASAPVLRVFLVILRPLNFLFAQWKRLLSVIFRTEESQGITEEELITMVSEAENEGGLDQHESELIRSAITFGDLEAGDILTPRVDIAAISDRATTEEIAAIFAESGYSRLPVYHEGIDDIIGVVHEKDFYSARYRGQGDISACISPIHYTAPNTRVDQLLRTLQTKKLHMAVVVDEYGGTEGLVTMEDIMEELVGEIWDEHDEVSEYFRPQGNGSYLISGSADLSDLYDLFSIRGQCDASTVSGWVVEQLRRLPQSGDRFQWEGLDVTVTQVDHRRVLEVLVKPVPEEAQ
ncbi:HlyC/CorC family transporter [Oscillibacter hominis]|uniref:HlyC/CorC family transporter n=1 Tax=Oscillibacter hominis TaxID=2763056 RepID=A0A7G9B491_9FIRM|nr:hemolysin family protein [Oscillibacter hominis]QNL44372.1 HlyC/CorC family transporter [Oscillibacter hominis]